MVLKALSACRTSALGGHVDSCDQCGYRQPAYNSCGNRHCPKCQGAARAAWLEARRAELLPVPYYHVVFTLPEMIARMALQNKRTLYSLLFACSAETLQEMAADPKHLGAEIGFLAVLHTWGQNLQHHPHVHCVVPGGGLSADAGRWIACRSNFFLPIRVLSRVFRGKFLARLRQAHAEQALSFHGSLATLNQAREFNRCVSQAYQQDWVVYAKPPFGGPEQVLKYLARYTHRIAISNDRLLSLQDGRVTFRWKNYTHGGRWQLLTLAAEEFIRRFLLHVLPQGFVRIRHYGLLANRHRQNKLACCRQLLAEQSLVVESPTNRTADPPLAAERLEEEKVPRCPACKEGFLERVEETPRPSARQLRISWPFDTT